MVMDEIATHIAGFLYYCHFFAGCESYNLYILYI